jgi:large subunit ribosomal protein L15
MKYNDLASPDSKSRKRVGRGIAAGQGKTDGRGTKGQGARTGFSKRPGFEGGQNPLMQRLPKLHGFRSPRVKPENVFTEQLNDLGAKVDNQVLADKGLVSSPYVRVKLLTRGELTKKVSVSLQAASQSAIDALQKAGGDFTVVPRTARPKAVKSDKK